jgi:hypothetical protein
MSVRVFILSLLWLSQQTVASELPSHWAEPITTEEVEALQKKQALLTALEERMIARHEQVFFNVGLEVNALRFRGNVEFIRSNNLWELTVLAGMEIVGLIDKYANENFDFDKMNNIPLKIFPPYVKGEPYWEQPPHPSQIPNPEIRAQYIKRLKDVKAYRKEYAFEDALRRAKETRLWILETSLYGKIPNKTWNAIDREKAKRIEELIRVAKLPQKTREYFQFLLVMMVECHSSLVKKAREQGDQTCAEHVKSLQKKI